jgi:hypothetical protein
MWEELAELIGGGGLSQDLLVQCLFHLALTTAWAPLNAVLALFMKRQGLIVIGLAEGVLVLTQRPPIGFFLWETAAIALSLGLAYGWVYYERPQKWERVGFIVGALLVAMGINGVIAVVTML